ncbi:MAG TPA: hypothetical protein VEP90_16905 [Methylomirabilota bacterium]|nr:hypothetical protein [Methylomirabilota bacterium]
MMDITGKIGPLWTIKSGSDWPMYSYERPAYIVWNAIANELHDLGWTDIQIKDWLQSKSPRWELDGQLGDILTRVVKKYAKVINSNPYWQARARKRG